MSLFNFSYEQENIPNLDGSPSRFWTVYGDNGNVIHAKKDSYCIVQTEDLSMLGETFIEENYDVKSFSHRNGEVIGLNINLGTRPTKVGDKSYSAIITVPNNGGGKGYLSIKEVRLICTNGMVRTLNDFKTELKIPHTIDYTWALDTMKKSIESFRYMLDKVEQIDTKLDSTELDRSDVLVHLNDWFYNYEMPESHKEGISLTEFRQKLYEDPESLKSIDRYKQLMTSLDKESKYNTELGLSYSMYTVYATITNYLSRRIEASKSSAPQEIQYQRAAEKLAMFHV
jgi:uncharacterized protein YozE (UPF0346 family)